MTDRPLLEADGLGKVFRLEGHTIPVFAGLSLRVRRGETVAITGPSGSGKSTLLNLLSGLDRPTAGDVRSDGVSLFRQMGGGRRAAWRARRVGLMFQAFHLLPEFDVVENVLVAVRARGGGGPADRKRAEALLGRLGLGDRLRHRPLELSGGEQQRVALARAMVNGPDLVLADEPTGNLDAATGAQVLDELFGLVEEGGRTLLVVTHQPDLAARCHRTLVLRDGGLVESPP